MAENFKACSIAGCNGNAHWRAGGAARGWCSAHYQMWRKHGDPLGGGTSPNEARDFLLTTVLCYEGDECLVWPYAKGGFGYGHIQFDGRHRHAHTVVCELAHGPAPSPIHEAAHSCGNGHLACVTKKHIRWATPAENAADRIEHGTVPKGPKVTSAKVTEDDVRSIRALKGSARLVDIAARFGISKSAVSLIHSRKNWAWVD